MSNVLVAQVIVEKLSHLLQRHVTGVNVILAIDVGHAHEIFDALESMMKFARTNGFLGDHVTRIPHCYTTSPVYDLTFQVEIDKNLDSYLRIRRAIWLQSCSFSLNMTRLAPSLPAKKSNVVHWFNQIILQVST